MIGGEDAEITDWPFMVSMRSETTHFCGGVLIDSTHVLTAGHCVDGNRPVRTSANTTYYFNLQQFKSYDISG